HSRDGYIDHLGDDGSPAGVVDAPAALGSTDPRIPLGNALFIDFDDPAGDFNSLGAPNGVNLEAAPGEGDSGGPILVEIDGQLQVSGVVAATDNPTVNGDGEHGELTIYPTVANEDNEAFLREAGVALDGAQFFGETLTFTIIDIEALISGYIGFSTAIAASNVAEGAALAHISGVSSHLDQVRRGTSRLNQVGGAEINSGRPQLAPPGTDRYEIWVGGDIVSTDIAGSEDFTQPNARLGQEIHNYSATVGVDYLISGNLIGGFAYSYLEGDASLEGASVDSDGDAVSAYLVGQAGALSASFLYSYASVESNVSRLLGGGQAVSSPETDVHTADLTANYTFQVDRLRHGPLAGVRFRTGRTNPYRETFNGQTGRGLIDVDKQDFDQWELQAGYSVSLHEETGWGLVAPYLSAAIVHQPGSDRVTTARFQTDTSQTLTLDPSSASGLALEGSSPTLSSSGDGLDNTFWRIQGGVDLLVRSGWNGGLYGFVLGDQATGEQFGGGVRVGSKF
ncbi:MAG: autotransporter outer membrane beta-barrel domain-containing protein, partial [Verrucomicrobiota bacterium]